MKNRAVLQGITIRFKHRYPNIKKRKILSKSFGDRMRFRLANFWLTMSHQTSEKSDPMQVFTVQELALLDKLRPDKQKLKNSIYPIISKIVGN